MNIRRSKTQIWTLNILIILCIAFTFILIYQKKAEGKFQPTSGKVFLNDYEKGVKRGDIKRGETVIDINNYSAIWKAPISGFKRVEAAELDNDTIDALEEGPIEDILSVIIILKSADPTESMARIYYPELEAEESEKPFKLQIWSKEGDPLKPPYDVHPFNGKVLKIEKDRVIFSYCGKQSAVSLEFLNADGSGSDAKNAVSPEDFEEVQEYLKNPPEQTTEFKPDHFFVSKNDHDQLRTGYENELAKITWASMTNPKTGKTELKLTAMEKSSLGTSYGLQAGDILVSINGFPVHNKAGAINYFKDHPNEGKYVVVISRHGKHITKTFFVPND